jgi:hypothetical protein
MCYTRRFQTELDKIHWGQEIDEKRNESIIKLYYGYK